MAQLQQLIDYLERVGHLAHCNHQFNLGLAFPKNKEIMGLVNTSKVGFNNRIIVVDYTFDYSSIPCQVYFIQRDTQFPAPGKRLQGPPIVEFYVNNFHDAVNALKAEFGWSY